jgi:riboflavin kinase/FMN adenylyltransferase
VERILADRLRLAHLVVGEDFRFGKDRTGDVALLERLGTEMGFVVETIPLVTRDEVPVSSSRIRELIEAGEVSRTAELLDSWFTITHPVVDGDKRGRQIGFPTANLRPPARKVIPARGVYACFATLAGEVHDAAVNVGVRPTFGGGELLIEAFILDFDEDIYGKELSLQFVQYLRPELEFSGVDELVARMGQDVVDTRARLDQVRSGI